MKRKRFMTLAFTIICCVVSVGVLKLKTAAAPGTESVGDISAIENQVVWHSEDITYLSRELDALYSEIGDSEIDDDTVYSVIFDSIDKRRNLLTSRGIINYDNGKVVANAASLLALADKTDTLANAYAATACYALNSIGTYFNTDGSINYESQAAESIVLNRARIVSGILQSQSVEHLAAAPVTADNITAGAAAWVNGECIIGNGADNERAYQRGIEDGAAENKEDVDIKYTYHEHTGNSGKNPIPDGDVYYSTSNPGGCYAASGHSHDAAGSCSKSICGGDVSLVDDGFGGTDWGNGETHRSTWKCTEGHTGSFTSSHWGDLPWDDGLCHRELYTCGEPVNTWRIGCGKKAGQKETAEVVIHKNKEAFK